MIFILIVFCAVDCLNDWLSVAEMSDSFCMVGHIQPTLMLRGPDQLN